MNTKEIELILKQGEGYNIEFKESISKTLVHEVCAFANSSGGMVIVGVKDNSNVKGIRIDNSVKSQVQHSISAINPRYTAEIKEYEYQGKSLLIIECKSGKLKPYIISGSIYVRIGANSQKLTTTEEMRDFFQQQLRIYFDQCPCERFNYPEDFNSEFFAEFLKESGITTTLSEKVIAGNLKLFTEDDKIKNGAALFFARNLTKHFDNANIRCLLFKGNTKRYILDDKKFEGNVIQQYNDAVTYLKSKLELRYEIESLGARPRKEILEIPEVALQEAIINALSHRDYYEKGARISIEIFDDKVEITNPGGLVSGISRDEFGTKSLSRNPLIFGLFDKIGLVEQAGTGIKRMKDAMVANNLPEPEFLLEGMFTVTFYRPVEFEKWIEKWKDKLLENQIKIIQEIHNNEIITIKQISKNIGTVKSTVDNNIYRLKKIGILKRIGSDKQGKWELIYKKI